MCYKWAKPTPFWPPFYNIGSHLTSFTRSHTHMIVMDAHYNINVVEVSQTGRDMFKYRQSPIFSYLTKNLFSLICLIIPINMIGNLGNATDRSRPNIINTNSLTAYKGVCRFFLSVKFATSLLTLLAGYHAVTLKLWICLFAPNLWR